jgi:hypothetical protein
LAITGVFGAEIPFASGASDALTYGITIQYSLSYLQQFDWSAPRSCGIRWIVPLALSVPSGGPECVGPCLISESILSMTRMIGGLEGLPV